MKIDVLDAVLASGASLPSPGLAFLELQKAGVSPDAGPREYARALESDPATCGAVMRIANSAVFRPSRPSRSLQEAIAMVGFSKTLAIAASVALRSGLEGLDAGVRAQIEKQLEIANQLATFTYEFALRIRLRKYADLAYLSALMQDTGTIIRLRRGDVVPAGLGPDLDGHPFLGAALMRNWKMPAPVAEVVENHHRPQAFDTLDPGIRILCSLLAAGRRIGHLEDDWSPEWAAAVRSALAISEEDLTRIASEA